jgi:hypothetical protein
MALLCGLVTLINCCPHTCTLLVCRPCGFCCRGYQVFFSGRNPLLRWKLPLLHKLLYNNGTWSYFCTIITTWTFLLVPFISLMFEIQPVKFGPQFALAASLYLFSNFVVSCNELALTLIADLSRPCTCRNSVGDPLNQCRLHELYAECGVVHQGLSRCMLVCVATAAAAPAAAGDELLPCGGAHARHLDGQRVQLPAVVHIRQGELPAVPRAGVL